MRYLLTVLLVSTLTLVSYGQDKIVKIDNKVIEGKILKVDTINIEVNPVGDKPFFIVPRSEVKLIIYDDNTVVSFESECNYNPYLEDMRLRMEAAEKLVQEWWGTEENNKSEGLSEAEKERIRRDKRIRREREAEQRRRQEEQAERINNLGTNTFSRIGGEEESLVESQDTSLSQNLGLGKRKVVGVISQPNVSNCNLTGRIVITVTIQVDRSGNVVSASVSSATYADNCIWSVVLAAAKKIKFTPDQDASFLQSGWIKYTIEP